MILTDVLRTGQVVVLGRPEVNYCLNVAREVLESGETDEKKIKAAVKNRFKKEELKNLLSLLDAGLDSAMFGRMVTSDVLSRCDAALHVAHAFTVHGEQAEDDYFSAVDDLLEESGETGSGHINSTELTSGLYYSYVVVDVALLVSNITGCKQHQWREAERDLAAEVVRRMVHLIATVSPGAKLGSTAPYSYAHMMMVESGSEAPRTLANAFMNPVNDKNGDLLGATYSVLAGHIQELDAAYGKPSHGRKALALGNKDLLNSSVDDLIPPCRPSRLRPGPGGSAIRWLREQKIDLAGHARAPPRRSLDELRRRGRGRNPPYPRAPRAQHAHRLVGQRLGMGPRRFRGAPAFAAATRFCRAPKTAPDDWWWIIKPWTSAKTS